MIGPWDETAEGRCGGDWRRNGRLERPQGKFESGSSLLAPERVPEQVPDSRAPRAPKAEPRGRSCCGGCGHLLRLGELGRQEISRDPEVGARCAEEMYKDLHMCSSSLFHVGSSCGVLGHRALESGPAADALLVATRGGDRLGESLRLKKEVVGGAHTQTQTRSHTEEQSPVMMVGIAISNGPRQATECGGTNGRRAHGSEGSRRVGESSHQKPLPFLRLAYWSGQTTPPLPADKNSAPLTVLHLCSDCRASLEIIDAVPGPGTALDDPNQGDHVESGLRSTWDNVKASNWPSCTGRVRVCVYAPREQVA